MPTADVLLETSSREKWSRLKELNHYQMCFQSRDYSPTPRCPPAPKQAIALPDQRLHVHCWSLMMHVLYFLMAFPLFSARNNSFMKGSRFMNSSSKSWPSSSASSTKALATTAIVTQKNSTITALDVMV